MRAVLDIVESHQIRLECFSNYTSPTIHYLISHSTAKGAALRQNYLGGYTTQPITWTYILGGVCRVVGFIFSGILLAISQASQNLMLFYPIPHDYTTLGCLIGLQYMI